MQKNKPWTISKEIPVVLIFSMLLQAGAVVWWASGIDRRQAQLEAAFIALDGTTRMARVETRLDILERGRP